jgi:glutaredoxin-related protein
LGFFLLKLAFLSKGTIIRVMQLFRLFGSKCRVKILEKMVIGYALTKIEEGFFIRELCRDIQEQINSVRRELMNLEELGILISKENNKKKFYTLNTKSPIYDALTSIFLNTYNPITDIEAFFKGRKKIEVVAVTEGLSQLFMHQ